MINSKNVGRIAERIVANEMEARGFRVSDLNKEGTAANADLVAILGSKTLQIQVKGTSQGPTDHCKVGYGYFKEQMIDGSQPIFNRSKAFYTANLVALVAVRSLKDYSCIILPIDIAEEAANLHLEAWRVRKWGPGPTNVEIELSRAKRSTTERAHRAEEFVVKERALLACYRDEQGWERLLQSN
jgi:hypothetical protein